MVPRQSSHTWGLFLWGNCWIVKCAGGSSTVIGVILSLHVTVVGVILSSQEWWRNQCWRAGTYETEPWCDRSFGVGYLFFWWKEQMQSLGRNECCAWWSLVVHHSLGSEFSLSTNLYTGFWVRKAFGWGSCLTLRPLWPVRDKPLWPKIWSFHWGLMTWTV